jgi:hypothetical protein
MTAKEKWWPVDYNNNGTTSKPGSLSDLDGYPLDYYFPHPTEKRKVYVRIMQYYGYPHYGVSIREEDNHVWDGRKCDYRDGPVGWVRFYENKAFDGQTENDFYNDVKGMPGEIGYPWHYSSYHFAKVVCDKMIAAHFPEHEVVWEDYSDHAEQGQREGD